ncbi:MAG: hypothetical protein WA628_13400 [Terriglobales bacterium]
MKDRSRQILAGILLALGCLTLGVRVLWSNVEVHASSLPKVVLSAESLTPRAIEQRTGNAVTHDYAQAWQDLADGLNVNRTDLLGDYFTGEAKLRLTQRISDQKKAGLRTQYLDNGHRVKAVFYSQDGGEMQLEDEVQLGVQIFDGQKVIYSANSTHKYLVLMTPGADRWYVRSLESVPNDAF